MSKKAPSLSELENRADFSRRHIGPGPQDTETMLKAVGLVSLEELVDKAVPRTIETDTPIDLPPPMTEAEALARLAEIAGRNEVRRSFIGMGYHGTFTPSVIRRNIIENPGWYTAYTPYQPEISQGRLEALVNFQQTIMDLTAMPVANASLLDEGSAAAEAMTLLHRVDKSKRSRFFVDADCHPQTIAVVETRARPLDIEVVVGNPAEDLDPEACFGALLQYPASDGMLRDDRKVIEAAQAAECRVAVAADLLSLALVVPPGEMGADIVLGSAQRFGVPLGFGGPHAAYFACKDDFRRSIPGRIVGVSVDSHGRPAMRLALQTREQHIRREKATSNICTAQVLLAVIAGFYAVYHGPEGIRRIAQRVHRLTAILAEGLIRLGHAPDNAAFFDTLTLDAGAEAEAILHRLSKSGINLRRYTGSSLLGISLDETATRADVEAIWSAFAGDKPVDFTVGDLDAKTADAIPESLKRESAYLTHPVFNSYHSETEMMRYLRRLAEKDIALNRSMIPLGSCTMKLNAATEMLPITWPEFANVHPFAPAEQTQGYRELIAELEAMLQAVTGFDSVSLQPNSGAQGEYAGLLTIRRYHESRGDSDRDICLIPSSAHGTNPASAVMAGMKVVVVDCDDHGNVDVDDLKAKAEKHGERLAALMVTYPSTHGVFEEAIRDICETVHAHGGQVYMDGANLNALLGLSKPAEFGADVMHMNLHKTFCIPHGGGGPGVGPIGCRAHLTPFRPNHPLAEDAGPEEGFGPVAAAPWGSAGILPISWCYIAMMGTQGLTEATKLAILNANYLAKRLSEHYPVLYTGKNGLVAHECIVDTRVLKDEAGISVDDVAKRLMDFGFHAPTMSWPVAGTLMIEPTESESMAELDRFCEAMIAIRREAKKVAKGDWPKDDNPLVNAPHTQEAVMVEKWEHPYSRQVAAYPSEAARFDKYWPPVGRVDNVYGDRHLVCSCPSIEDYRSAAE